MFAIGIKIFHIETFFVIETREIFTNQFLSLENFSLNGNNLIILIKIFATCIIRIFEYDYIKESEKI